MKSAVPSSPAAVCYFARRPSLVSAVLRTLGYLALLILLVIAAAALVTAL